ncbi:hypothetical protein STEG23_003059, partial [Scotinomys teguina]
VMLEIERMVSHCTAELHAPPLLIILMWKYPYTLSPDQHLLFFDVLLTALLTRPIIIKKKSRQELKQGIWVLRKRGFPFISTEDENLWIASRLVWFDQPRPPDSSQTAPVKIGPSS